MAAPGAVRKTVTVLFCDVADSTGLGEQLDPELLRAVMSRWFAAMRKALEAHGGTVEKFIGDAIMAVFGVPTVHEDDALRAVRAAGEMRRRLAVLNEELAEHGITLQMRVGINTGEVVAGDPSAGHSFVTGDTVNVAKRLEQAAGPGEILIGTATYPLVKDAVQVGPLERFSAKGKRDGAERRRVDEIDHEAPGLARRLDVPMVGRQPELDLMRRAYERAVAERRCRLFTVLGPAGIGKSRLAAEFSTATRARTVTGRCLPYGNGITFWPLTEIVRELGAEEGLRGALAGSEDADAIAERILAAVGAADASARTEETFWAVRRAFEQLAQQEPLVVCFEDIHWAEPTFLDLIEYLVGWSRDAPVFVLCLARPELVEQRPTLISLQQWTDSVALEPLSEGETEALLDRFGAEATLAQETRERIARAAEGNPLFVEQMAAMAAESPSDGELAVPPSIHALLAERLDRLTPDEQAVIRRASVIGRDFSARDVAALSPPEDRPLVARHLLSLLRKGLVHPDVSRTGPEDRFRFHHALVGDTAYDGLPKETRADLHERLADQIQQTAAERVGELEEIVGYHLEQAFRSRAELGRSDEHTEAIAARAAAQLGIAGRRAFDRGDLRAAASLIGRASALLPPTHPDRLELAPLHVLALMVAGRLPEAEDVVSKALSAACDAGARGVEARCLVVRANLRFFTHPADAVADAQRVAARAIQTFDELGDQVGLAHAWRLLAYADATRGRWADTVERYNRALDHAERSGDRREQSNILSLLPLALCYGPTPAEEAIARCEEIRERTRDDTRLQAGVAAFLAPLHAMRGRFEQARAHGTESTALLEELGALSWLASARAHLGQVEMLAGRPDAAERELRLAHHTFDQIGDGVNAAAAAALLADALAAQGRHAEADGWSEAADESVLADDVHARVVWGAARAKALARAENLDQAERLARDTVVLADATDALNMRADASLALATVLLESGRTAEATAAAETALELYRAKGNLAAVTQAEKMLAVRRPLTVSASRASRRAPGRPAA
jgi:class 3 adenylate cyclase/tetratricopeptide (TPR) repeat protein